jgi:hypothetical protein
MIIRDQDGEAAMKTRELAIAAMPAIRLKQPVTNSRTAAKMIGPRPSPRRLPAPACEVVADVIVLFPGQNRTLEAPACSGAPGEAPPPF